LKVTKIDAEDYWKIIQTHPKFTGCVEDADGWVAWYKNGEKHREDGPAVYNKKEMARSVWYLEDIQYSTAQWQQEVLNRRMKRIVST
jgi:hypothetical protein